MSKSPFLAADTTEANGQPLHPPGRGLAQRLLTEAEICELLRVSREAVLKFRRHPNDPIPCLKAGRRYLYDTGKVLRWAERQADRARLKATRSR